MKNFILGDDVHSEVFEYFKSLTLSSEKRKWALYIGIVEEKGTWIGDPYVGHIEDDIWEIRPGPHRILFFIWGDKFVATNAFRKKGKKTPESEKRIARRVKRDWIQRHGQK